MPSSSEAVSGVDWPPSFERRSPAERKRTRKFDVTLAQAFDDLESELDQLGVDDFRYSFDAQKRKRDGRPYSRANPDDPSFVLRWSMGGEQYAVACDRWTSLRDNVRSVGLYVREKRKMESRPVETGESEFANARLPSGEEDAIEAAPPAHQVLGVDADADPTTVKEAFREKSKELHPDVEGGDGAAFKRLKRAREAMLE